ncbi:hypothetical protein MMC34_007361 [Xylographa carneopallida]|nr:hypothetical protein [Xylographa carneopallida]
MRSTIILGALAGLPLAFSQVTTSPKRGLVYVPNANYPQDNNIWDSSSSDLTWYYNYGPEPSPNFSNATKFQFVPMLFGAPNDTTDTSFLTSVQSQISAGANISHILTFNEPDGTSATGGSDVPSKLAAETWIREVEPLKSQGVKLGAPAVTGAQTGFTWLQQFFTACAGNCSADFIPIHWYGDFGGLASHIGQVRAAYPNMSIWITEYADPGANLTDSQSFFNESMQYFDRIECVFLSFFRSDTTIVIVTLTRGVSFSYITRYSYFGAFRSSVSNVGPDAAMLTQDGQLTDIGSWYLGGSATGFVPSAASHTDFSGSSWLLVLAVFWCLS